MGGVKLALTSFSESPLHLLTMEDAEMLKKVVLHSVATALASRVFPVPGGRGGEREGERNVGVEMLKKEEGPNQEDHREADPSMERECL